MGTTETTQDRLEESMIQLYALALDALIDQGVEVTEEQYRLALEEAGRRGKTRKPHVYYPRARAAATASHIVWARELLKQRSGNDHDTSNR